MRVCPECGAVNEDGEDFCGQCGTYLDWEGEKAAADEQAAAAQPEELERDEPPATAETVEQPRGFVERVREAVGIGPAVGAGAEGAPAPASGTHVFEGEHGRGGLEVDRSESEPSLDRTQELDAPVRSEPPTPGPGTERVASPRDKGPGPVPEPEGPAGPGRTDPSAVPPAGAKPEPSGPAPDASSLVVKVPPAKPPRRGETRSSAAETAGPQARRPGADQPGAVRPGAAAPRPRRRTPTPSREPVDHGDLVCGACGAGNKPTRKFCRRCGHDLVDAVVAKVPWWRRIFRRRKAQAAGSRPKPVRPRRHRPGKYAVLLLVLTALAVAGYSYRDALAGAYERVMDRVVGSEPFHPPMSASSSAPGAGPARANDGKNDAFWAPATTGPARGQFLRAEFERPVRLLHLVVTPGVSTKEPQFLANGRPTLLRLAVTDSAGEVRRERLEVADKAGPQTFDVIYEDVERVRLTVLASEAGSRPGSRVAIAEVEFHGRD